MKRMITVAAAILMAATAAAENEPAEPDPIRPLPELFEALRSETRPAELIDAYMEFSCIVFDDFDVIEPPDGFAWEVAEQRIAANPALYAPEIRRRLLDTLPERIESAEQLVALGRMRGPSRRLRTLVKMTTTLGRAHAEPILRELWDRSSMLLHQAEPFYDKASVERGAGQ